MLISIEKDEQITVLSAKEMENPELPSFPTISTDVNVVPEQEKLELETSVSSLDGEIKELRLRQRYYDDKRREALNKILDTKGCIRVFCRIRPLLSTKRKIHQMVVDESEKITVGSAGNKKEFHLDRIFSQETTQEDVFVEVKPIIRSALDGHNVCVLAYGQTGTGKTYTMDGTSDSPGIVLNSLQELFRQSSLDSSASFSFSISMLEVYLGNIRDLLAPKQSCNRIGPVRKCNLNIQTDPKGYVEIEGLSEIEISNFTKASWCYNKGRRARSTSSTNVNVASSRSHCLIRINIFRRGYDLKQRVEIRKLWMVDLGGSERLLKTGATGQTLDEGRAINLSLSALGDVIAALKRNRGHVPYRNSKLTQILKDSLGTVSTFYLHEYFLKNFLLLYTEADDVLEDACYGSKVLMLVHVSQYEEDIPETTCSLAFAQRVRGVESTRELPEDIKRQNEKKIAELEVEMGEAAEEHKNITNQIKKLDFLLSEKIKLFSTTYNVDDDDRTPISEKEEQRETPKTPIKCEKEAKMKVNSSLPRFMKATMASRQRQNDVEKEAEAKTKMLKSWLRSSVQISSSQSRSLSDPHFNALLRNSNKKTANGEKSSPLIENTRFNNYDLRVNMLRSSDPNVKVNVGRHRRRMSDMI